MKTLVFTKKNVFKSYGFFTMVILVLFAVNPTYGQTEVAGKERTVKGIVSNEKGPLKDVNITQEGTRNGVVTNDDGEFTFPAKLKPGDELTISYIGYVTQKVKIEEDTSFLKIVLSEDLIEMIGALDANTPYKSKRKKN